MHQIPSPGAFCFEHTVLHKLLFLSVVKHLVCWAAGRMWDWEDLLDQDDYQDTCPVTLQPLPAPLLEGAQPVRNRTGGGGADEVCVWGAAWPLRPAASSKHPTRRMGWRAG